MESNGGSHPCQRRSASDSESGPRGGAGRCAAGAGARAGAAKGDPAIRRLRVPRLKALPPVVLYMAANSEPLVRPEVDRPTKPVLAALAHFF